MSLLPSKPDTSAAEADAEPRVIGVDSDDADDVISALSSDTARQLLVELHEDPAPPSELADRVDTSLQNAQYHLEKLQSAGAVSVVDTAYSAKGREMDVYAPADQPLVIFAGDEKGTSGLRSALTRLISGVGVLGVGSLIVQHLYGDAGEESSGVAPAGSSGPDGAAGPTAETTAPGSQEPVSSPEVGETVTGVNDTSATYVVEFDGTKQNFSSEIINASDRQRLSYELVSDDLNATLSFRDANSTANFNGTNEILSLTDLNGTLYLLDSNGTGYMIGRQVIATTPTLGERVEATSTASETVTQTVAGNATTATDASMAGIEPGLLFFAGGLVVLALWLGVWYARTR